jgi:hypothetical protein
MLSRRELILAIIATYTCSCGETAKSIPAAKTPTNKQLFGITVGGKYGFIDTTGRIAVNPQYDDTVSNPNADPFPEGLAAVCIGCTSPFDNKTSNGKWGFIDPDGKMIINPQFNWVQPFSEGLAAACVGDRCDLVGPQSNAKWGFIDRTGRFVISPQFSAVGPFSEGLADVCVGVMGASRCEGKEGYINRNGQFIINPQFEMAYPFHRGLARITITEGVETKTGYIDKTGRVVWEPSK